MGTLIYMSYYIVSHNVSDELLPGEFTQENQVRLKHEEEKEQTRVDEWKVNI